ncbi:phospholipase effector Tle1 domain-containing protein [Sphingobacterium sp. Mn56C]|uniref:phospholipase effector Tle1 domain-containing protein n=1 Tax=Sphingobacterium sp. Mn56C TaxID=3395261 RepID=UPI003BBE8365
MGKTFVYNSGKVVVPKEELQPSFGIFFDGTLNNKENTRIREAVQSNTAKDWEKKVYKKNAGHAKDSISYQNDYTNIARQWSACKKDYAIYIEGIGTVEVPPDIASQSPAQLKKTITKIGDVSEGYLLGSGDTGIRGKVRRGCEKLVEKLKNIVNTSGEKEEKKLTSLTLDIFGFSRGAAAARNFLYEINGSRRAIDDELTSKKKLERVVEVKNKSNNRSRVEYKKVYKTLYYDRDKKEVDVLYTVNNKLPRFGYLGYLLLKNGILSKEELEGLILCIRFIGLYDTVSSYEEVNNQSLSLGAKVGAHLLNFNQFEDDVAELQLNNLGRFQKAVHFTAMDEYRINFSLTRMQVPAGSSKSVLIEKNLPGAHCDIGGAYLSGFEEIPITKEHIKGYWYRKDQTQGKRYVRKEYSYIPLHFMETLFRNVLAGDADQVFACKIDEKYPLKINKYDHELLYPTRENRSMLQMNSNSSVHSLFPPSKKQKVRYNLKDDEVLLNAKDYLRRYVFGDGQEWKFIDDSLLKKRKKRVAQNQLIEDSKRDKEEETGVKNEQETDFKVIKIKEVLVKGYDSQLLLRKLRNSYLHLSARISELGMKPRSNNLREEF